MEAFFNSRTILLSSLKFCPLADCLNSDQPAIDIDNTTRETCKCKNSPNVLFIKHENDECGIAVKLRSANHHFRPLFFTAIDIAQSAGVNHELIR
jgi:hypothetical protein